MTDEVLTCFEFLGDGDGPDRVLFRQDVGGSPLTIGETRLVDFEPYGAAGETCESMQLDPRN